jgi:hypothetical protein
MYDLGCLMCIRSDKENKANLGRFFQSTVLSSPAPNLND